MPEDQKDQMRYDQLAQNALRGVVREALRIVARTGLPGEHHFYIAFNTRFPGVSLSPRLSERYPREMTVVLQHQFWNLSVLDDRFEVELSFDNIPEKLVVPYNSIKGFLDPSVQFGLQFEVVPFEEQAQTADTTKPSEAARSNNTETDSAKGTAVETAPAPDQKVVSLDAFRKK